MGTIKRVRVEVNHEKIVELTEAEVVEYIEEGDMDFYRGQPITGGPWDEDGNPVVLEDMIK